MKLTEPIILTGIGAIIAQFYFWFEQNKIPKSQRPNTYQQLASFIFYTFTGLVLGYIYFADQSKINRILCFHIGLSSPLILKSMLTTPPKNIPSSE